MFRTLAVSMTLVFYTSCSKDTEVLNRPPVSMIRSSDGIDRILLDGSTSSDPEGRTLSYTWSTSSNAITVSDANKASAFFKLPATLEASDQEITLKVTDGKSGNVSTTLISVPPLTQVRAYGLGKDLTAEVSNTVGYEWYLDQGNTGSYASVNCGPTSVTMALKWVNENFGGTPLDARQTFHANGGWWYTNDIITYLSMNQVSSTTIALHSMKDLQDEIDHGNIVILCLDMYYVSAGTDGEYRKDKFYQTAGQGWGHFIVIKGYKDVDDHIFFEAYDPFSFGLHYLDDSIKGKNRYYKGSDLDLATNNWWDYAIVVSRNSEPGGRRGVDTNTIVHKPGR